MVLRKITLNDWLVMGDPVSQRFATGVRQLADHEPPERLKDTVEISFHPEDNDAVFDVTEGDSGVQTRSLYVGTDKAPPSDLHFRLCFRGNAAWNTDYRVREHDGGQWARGEPGERLPELVHRRRPAAPGNPHRYPGRRLPGRGRRTGQLELTRFGGHLK